MRIGQALQHKRVHDREDRGVCADRKRQRKDHHRGKAWITPELAQSIACILPKKLEAGAGAVVAHRLLYLLDAAKLRKREAARLRRRHAGGDSFVRNHIHIRAQLIVKLPLNLLFPEEISQEAVDPRPEFHLFALSCFQSICHRQGHPRPFLGLDFKLVFSSFGEPIKLRATVIFRFAPEGTQPTRFFHAVKRRKQRTRLDKKCPMRRLFDAPRNAQTVQFSRAKRFENEQIERALQEICLF
jgi:hypothetical protein